MAKLHSSLSPERIREEFFSTGQASLALEGRTELVDAVVCAAHQSYLAPAFPQGLALLAVGGFGRRELFPHSDVDALLLVEKAPEGAARAALSEFIRSLWDAGLRLSHSVRTIRECCEVHDDNIELNISLLDQRPLAGDQELYQKLAARLPVFLEGNRQSLVRHLARLTRARHAKFQDTIYHLQPNIKESPGGVRDIHLLEWLQKFPGDPVAGTGRLEPLGPARDFLYSLRCYLHYRAGRDDNTLTFEAQEEITEQSFLPFAEPEVWMREYFRHVRAVQRLAIRALEASEDRSSSLLAEFKSWRSRLSNAEFTVSRERVFFKSPQQIDRDPELALRIFERVGRHRLRLAQDSERRISELLPRIASHFASAPALWPALREILSLPHASLALEAMHQTGVLGALFPEWERIECLVVRDFYHQYTVDEHTLVAIATLDRLGAAQDPAWKRFANLMAELPDPAVLRFALLFHDVGKGGGEGEHVAASLELARPAMERIRMPEDARDMVEFLIERHLDLSAVMTGRDLDDPSTARYLAGRMGTMERLKNLTLLTFADISAVHPHAMTAWRLEQLWRVYTVAHHELTRELDTERIHSQESGKPEKSAFLEGLPTRYLHTHTPQDVDGHLELARRSAATGVALDFEKLNGVFRLTVVTRDRPSLLASIAGALSSFGMNILKAEAFGNAQGLVLDTFVFADPNRTLELNPQEMDRLRLTIERVVVGRVSVKTLLQNRPRPAPPSRRSRLQPKVNFDADSSDRATLIEIVAEDRPGLLYDLAGTLSAAGCNIEVVLIETEANKAMDVFYVTSAGHKLTPVQQQELQHNLLAVCRS